jgi:putative peptidoglycan lipid II flippase
MPAHSAPKSLLKAASLIVVVTLLSKVAGLVRAQAMTAQYGLSSALDAYNLAYSLPAFFLIILGGVNGPFHSAIVSVLSKDSEDKPRVIETLNTLVALAFGAATVGIMVAAPWIVGLVAQGAPAEVQAIAVHDMRIMAPLAFIAGQVGLGFGVLTTANSFVLPSLSPILSSGAVIVAILFFAKDYGAQVLAWGTLAGALLQWFAQVPLQWKLGLGSLRPRFDWHLPQVRQVMKLMAPATLSSTLANLNTYTDQFFASFLGAGVIGGLPTANLLVQTPQGILSNAFLIPLLPVYSRLSGEEDRSELLSKIRQGLITLAIAVLPLMAFCIALSEPIVQIIYQRGAFNSKATQLVSGLFIAGTVGMFSFLGRDLMIRLFYVLGDGKTPLIMSFLGIALNFALDFLLIKWIGAPGIPLATTGVTTITFVGLAWLFRKKVGPLGWRSGLFGPLAILFIGALFTGALTWGVYAGLQHFWPGEYFFAVLTKLLIALSIGLASQALWLWRLDFPEITLFRNQILRRFKKST